MGSELTGQFKQIRAIPNYLGVPLITSRLTHSDCGVLKERMLAKIQSWSNKLLTYGGRSQLIASVLFGIQVDWCSTFIMPQEVLKEIEGMLRAFLWKRVGLQSVGAKVYWKTVCTPKKGGWAFVCSKDWNRAAMLRHLWALCSKEDILGVKWVVCT